MCLLPSLLRGRKRLRDPSRVGDAHQPQRDTRREDDRAISPPLAPWKPHSPTLVSAIVIGWRPGQRDSLEHAVAGVLEAQPTRRRATGRSCQHSRFRGSTPPPGIRAPEGRAGLRPAQPPTPTTQNRRSADHAAQGWPLATASLAGVAGRLASSALHAALQSPLAVLVPGLTMMLLGLAVIELTADSDHALRPSSHRNAPLVTSYCGVATLAKHHARRRHGEHRLPVSGWGTRRSVYRPRRATQTPLYPVVQHHLETFLAQAAEADTPGEGVPPWSSATSVATSSAASSRTGSRGHGVRGAATSG